MVTEMHSETDPEFIPKIHRNQTPRTSKTMISLERGINFHEIQGSLKGLHFDSILEARGCPEASRDALGAPFGSRVRFSMVFCGFWDPFGTSWGSPGSTFWALFQCFCCTCSRTLKSHVKEQKMMPKELQNTSQMQSKWRPFRDPWIS